VTLDPQAEGWLKEVAAAGLPPLQTLPVADFRGLYRQVVADCGLQPEPVVSIAERTIPGPAGEIPIRVYTPEGSPQFPVLVYFHGGGWVIGDLEVVHGPLTVLANLAHAVIVSVDYRLAPEHPFPAAVEDCDAAVRWVAANASLLNVDPERIAVGGDSAGGNLAAVVALMARDRGGPKLIHQLLLYPVTDCTRDTASYREHGDGYFLTADLMDWFQAEYLGGGGDPGDWRASPLRAADLSGLPPAYVVTGEYDPLRDEGEAYAARLLEAGGTATVARYDGQIHAFAANLAGVMDEGRRAVEDAGRHLRTVFRRGWSPRPWATQ
jgi:acetyl esterase